MRHDPQGFTLVELMIVMTILAVMALATTPVFRTSFSAARADHAARDLFAEIKAAQERAVAGAIEYRMYFNVKANTYWPARPGVSKDGRAGFIPVAVPGGEAIRAPGRLAFGEVKGRRGVASDTFYLSFYPSGVGDAGRVTLHDVADRSRKYVIETTGTRATLTLPEMRK